jgi:hypothetical protein
VEKEAKKLISAGRAVDPLVAVVAEGGAGGEIVDTEGRRPRASPGLLQLHHRAEARPAGGRISRSDVRSGREPLHPARHRRPFGDAGAGRTARGARALDLRYSSPNAPLPVSARVRSRQTEVAAVVTPLEGDRARVTFNAPSQGGRPGTGRRLLRRTISASAAGGSRISAPRCGALSLLLHYEHGPAHFSLASGSS